MRNKARAEYGEPARKLRSPAVRKLLREGALNGLQDCKAATAKSRHYLCHGRASGGFGVVSRDGENKSTAHQDGHSRPPRTRSGPQQIRSLAWRDTKAALVLFIRNRDVTAVIKKARQTLANHDGCVRVEPAPDESVRSDYVLRSAIDSDASSG
jgi:hypothetical protein